MCSYGVGIFSIPQLCFLYHESFSCSYIVLSVNMKWRDSNLFASPYKKEFSFVIVWFEMTMTQIHYKSLLEWRKNGWNTIISPFGSCHVCLSSAWIIFICSWTSSVMSPFLLIKWNEDAIPRLTDLSDSACVGMSSQCFVADFINNSYLKCAKKN